LTTASGRTVDNAHVSAPFSHSSRCQTTHDDAANPVDHHHVVAEVGRRGLLGLHQQDDAVTLQRRRQPPEELLDAVFGETLAVRAELDLAVELSPARR
jgi:hypothetical protein